MIVFEATFLVLATINASLYAGLAFAARRRIRQARVRRAVNRTGGTLMVAAGVLALGWRRTA